MLYHIIYQQFSTKLCITKKSPKNELLTSHFDKLGSKYSQKSAK